MNEREALHFMIDNPGKVVVGPWGYRYRIRKGNSAFVLEIWSGVDFTFCSSLAVSDKYRVEEEKEEECDINHICNVVAEYIHAPQADRELDRIAVTRSHLNYLAAALLRKVERMIEEKR